MLVAGETLIAADAGTSIYIYERAGGRTHESNPLLGQNPSAQTFLLLGAGVMAGNAAAWWVLPNPWRTFLEATVIGLEAATVTHNLVLCASF